MKKLIGALTILAIGAWMTVPANAVVVLTAGTPETVNLKLFSSGIQEVQFTVPQGDTDELTITSGKKNPTPLGDFAFASFESNNVPKTFKLGIINTGDFTFGAGTWDFFVGFNPFDSFRILNSTQPLIFSLAEPSIDPPTEPVGGVPEPSTWAMMILGFAALGLAALRRSQKSLALVTA